MVINKTSVEVEVIPLIGMVEAMEERRGWKQDMILGGGYTSPISPIPHAAVVDAL